MSDDPQTVAQIAALALDDRPLLVVDVDEVVLTFVVPFSRYLGSRGLSLRTDTFRLHGNVVDADGLPISDADVSAALSTFFEVQGDWQDLTDGAAETLAALAGEVQIVLLSSMPHRRRGLRRALLDRLGIPYPLISTETAKGPAILLLRGPSRRPVAFVDDIPRNLLSAAESVPDVGLFHLMSHTGLRALLMPLAAPIVALENWQDGLPKIRAALGLRVDTADSDDG